MTPDQMRQAQDLLYRNWEACTQIDGLPPALVPADRAEAYRVQALIEKYSSRPVFGWKIAATSVAGQQHIGVDGPLAGRILAERVLPDGGICALGNNLMRVAELEFVFRMGADLPPRAMPYGQDEVLAPYTAKYLEAAETMWEHLGTHKAATALSMLFPRPAASQALLDEVDAWLASTNANPGAQRYVAEGRADVVRYLAGQAKDAEN